MRGVDALRSFGDTHPRRVSILPFPTDRVVEQPSEVSAAAAAGLETSNEQECI